MVILVRETHGENGKARRQKYRCPQRMTDGVFMPLDPETRGSITSVSLGTGPLCYRGQGSGKGGKRVQVSRLTEGAQAGWPGECTRECACARLCMGAFYVNLVKSLLFIYPYKQECSKGRWEGDSRGMGHTYTYG